MIQAHTSRRLLQIAVALAGVVPVAAGLAGVVQGAGLTGDTAASAALDSHVRYLSGVLLAIGLAFWGMVPRIETQTRRFGLLAAIVVCGGLARLGGVLAHGWPSGAMLGGMAMELGVTPLLCLWQRRIGRAADIAGQDLPATAVIEAVAAGRPIGTADATRLPHKSGDFS